MRGGGEEEEGFTACRGTRKQERRDGLSLGARQRVEDLGDRWERSSVSTLKRQGQSANEQAAAERKREETVACVSVLCQLPEPFPSLVPPHAHASDLQPPNRSSCWLAARSLGPVYSLYHLELYRPVATTHNAGLSYSEIMAHLLRRGKGYRTALGHTAIFSNAAQMGSGVVFGRIHEVKQPDRCGRSHLRNRVDLSHPHERGSFRGDLEHSHAMFGALTLSNRKTTNACIA